MSEHLNGRNLFGKIQRLLPPIGGEADKSLALQDCSFFLKWVSIDLEILHYYEDADKCDGNDVNNKDYVDGELDDKSLKQEQGGSWSFWPNMKPNDADEYHVGNRDADDVDDDGDELDDKSLKQ